MRAWLKAEILLPAVIVIAALLLAVSEFMTTFEFTPPGGDPLSDQLAADRHGYAMLVLAVFAVASLVIAVVTGQRAWAWATAGFGVAALALFLIVDLPDVNRIGDVEAPGGFGLTSAEAVPQPGFWLEAAGAIVLGLASIAFATQPAEQRQAPRRLFESRRKSGAEKARNAARPADQKP
jgi:hypothetical protein